MLYLLLLLFKVLFVSLIQGAGFHKMFTYAHSRSHMLLTSVVLGIIILATIVGNVFVIAAIVLERNLRNVANYLIASLAVADLLVAALVMPLAAVKEVSSGWFLGKGLCDAWTSFDVLCCTSSILHLVAISLDRYWAVTRVDYIHNRSARRILVMVAASWGISAVISIPPLFVSSNRVQMNNTATVNSTAMQADDLEECLINQDWGYAVFATLSAFYIPLLFMMIIYASIYRVARARIRKKQFLRTLRIKSEKAAAAAAAAAAQESNGLRTPEDLPHTGASVNVMVTEITDDTEQSRQVSTTRSTSVQLFLLFSIFSVILFRSFSSSPVTHFPKGELLELLQQIFIGRMPCNHPTNSIKALEVNDRTLNVNNSHRGLTRHAIIDVNPRLAVLRLLYDDFTSLMSSYNVHISLPV